MQSEKMDSGKTEAKKFDLHIHTFLSKDSLIDPKLLPKVASSRGLAGFAVTDHNAFGAHRMIEPRRDLIIIPGIEIRTSIGDIIALFLEEPVKSDDPLEAYDEVRMQDGVLIAAHPFGFPRLRWSMSEGFLRFLDGIEVFNARNLLPMQNRKALVLAKRLGKAEIGGSDAHSLCEVGRAYTLAVASNPEELRLAIKSKITKGEGRLSLPLVHFSSFTARIVHALSRRV